MLLQAEAVEDEPEPHVDPDEPASTVALLMCAAGPTDMPVALDWARTMLDHLHTAPYRGASAAQGYHPCCTVCKQNMGFDCLPTDWQRLHGIVHTEDQGTGTSQADPL